MRNPFRLYIIFFKSYSNYVEKTFVVSVRNPVSAFQKTLGSLGYLYLLPMVYIILRGSLDVLSAGLYLHKMYSILV